MTLAKTATELSLITVLGTLLMITLLQMPEEHEGTVMLKRHIPEYVSVQTIRGLPYSFNIYHSDKYILVLQTDELIKTVYVDEQTYGEININDYYNRGIR